MQFSKIIFAIFAAAALVTASPINLDARDLTPQEAGQKSWGGMVEVDKDGQALFTPIAQATTKLLNGKDASSDIYKGINTLDHVVDGTASFLANVLTVPTLGLSKDVGNFLTGPIVQSLTHGTFAIISNVVGAPVDEVGKLIAPAAASFSKSSEKLISQLTKMNVDTSSAQRANDQLKQTLASKGFQI